MTDNLVERLRNWEKVYPEDEDKPEGSLHLEAADRIEELEAKLAKAVEALDSVMKHMPDYPDTAWIDASETLAELTEGNDG